MGSPQEEAAVRVPKDGRSQPDSELRLQVKKRHFSSFAQELGPRMLIVTINHQPVM